jgi:SNF2 family DNA or RNA helicase
MPKLTTKCPVCQKELKLKEEILLGEEKLFTYTCGHSFARDVTHVDVSVLDFTSKDGSGKKARAYQETGVEFILENDFNTIIADQMRLGKTPTALLALANAYKEKTPCLILVKGANLWQWIREYKVWCSILPNGIFPIIGSKGFVPAGFSSYIMSMDTFSKEEVREKLKKIPFKLVIVDEAHSFKNTESNRSQALVDFITFLNTGESVKTLEFKCARCQNAWTEEGRQKYDKRIGHAVISKSSKCTKCGTYCYVQQQHEENDVWKDDRDKRIDKLLALASPNSGTTEHERALALSKAKELGHLEKTADATKPCGLILLTGTPILNRADEYFVPLNLINPEKFSSLERFRRQWLEQDSKGRWSRVKPYLKDQFKNEIKPFLLRREKEDVFKDLPAINRIFTVIEPDKDLYAKQYNKILDKMEEKLAEKANPSYWDLADQLMELRRICGMMKLMWTSDYLEACALESATKYAVGIHHESVRDVLYLKLGGEVNCYKLYGGTNSENKDRIMREWEHSNKQFLIINMLAGGVGMDFHYCDNVVILERQWNAETERQFEFRFYNPSSDIKKNPLTIEYVLAKGTLDEWWYNMLEEKKLNVDPLVYNNWDITSGNVISFKDLAEQTVSARL